MKPTMSLTQSAVLHFMRDSQLANGVMPTCKEIATAFSWSSANAAHEHVQHLVRKGYIEVVGKRYRFTERAWVVLRASQPQGFAPSLIALPVVDPSKVRDRARVRIPA